MYNLIHHMKRTQIYLDYEQDRRLQKRAKATGQTKSALIRAAIDRLLARDTDPSEFEAALQETAGALPKVDRPSRDDWDRGYG